MDLKEAKQKIRLIPTEGVEEDIPKLQGWLMDPDDCFGQGYYQDGGSQKLCDECSIRAELEGRVAPLNVFCKELTEGFDEEVKAKIRAIKEKIKQYNEE